MKLRSGRTTMATPPSAGGSDLNNMDASLWGELYRFVDLSFIYAKLPLGPFSRLRQVCKEWNRLASDRQFLQQNFKAPISNLYFVVKQRTGHRLWVSRGSSWTSSPVPRGRCEVSGLLYEDSDRHGVFDLHTRVFHRLPAPYPAMKMHGNSMVAMTVDTTLIPYGFKVLITNLYYGTSIFDSKSGAWTLKPSHHASGAWTLKPSHHALYRHLVSSLSSVYYKKFLYVSVEIYHGEMHDVHTYDLENYVWNAKIFEFPQSIRSFGWKLINFGLWQDRWFLLGVNSSFTVWVANTHSNKESWTTFDRMPNDLCKWMTRDSGYEHVRSTFCGKHVLVYNWLEVDKRAVLYNLDSKTWDKIELL